MVKQVGTGLLALLLAAFCIEIGTSLVMTGRLGFAQTAEAIVGRPLTPVSVAGAARRTVRRCAVGVYNC